VKKSNFYWHIHHETLVEPATEPIENRIRYIRNYKQPSEVGTRLRLLKPVKGKLPVAITKAWDAYVKTQALRQVASNHLDKARRAQEAASTLYRKNGNRQKALDEAFSVYAAARDAADQTWTTFDQLTRGKCPEALNALHRKECKNCPWDGKTIFP
jgi:hypothetical protein